MKNLFLILCIAGFSLQSFGQQNPRPSRSRFYTNKAATFNLKAGDLLVYNLNDSGNVSEFVVTVKKFSDAISFEYTMPSGDTKTNLNINANAVKTATVYNTAYADSVPNFNNRTSVWLSQKNYRDLAATKKTMMDFGNGADTFLLNTTSTYKVNYKGKPRIVTVYKINNTNPGHTQEMTILNDLQNPLIVTMNKGYTLTLKEVR